jgi:hypothetical protein
MKSALKIAVAALCALAAPALAQNSATSTTTSSATVIQTITLTNNTLLAFGTVIKPTTTTTTVTIDPTSGARTFTGGDGVAGGSAASGRATYTVGGEGGQTFSINAPSFNLTSGANTLVVTTTTSAASGTLSGAIGSIGSATFGVGGSIPVTTTTTSAAYSGNLAVTVAYN